MFDEATEDNHKATVTYFFCHGTHESSDYKFDAPTLYEI
jgi:hypothetical protein